MNRFTQLTTAGLLATTLLLTGCASKWDQRMAALKKDPMATATWEGIELLTTEESANDSYKSPGPSITLCYRSTLPDEDTFKTILSTAVNNGWVEKPAIRTKVTTVATKELPYGWHTYTAATLSIAAGTKTCRKTPDGNVHLTLRAG